MVIPGLRGMSLGAFARELKKTTLAIGPIDLAAQLAYYAVFALFPFAIFLVTLIGDLRITGVTDELARLIAAFAPDQIQPLLAGLLKGAVSGSSRWLQLLSIGVALVTASSGVAALITALNRAYGVEETRPWWRVRLRALLITVGGALMLIVAVAALVIGPQLAEGAARWFHLDHTVARAWGLLRWPTVVLGMASLLAGLYYLCPDVDQPFKFVTPGSVIGVLLWIGLSLLFRAYVGHVASYNKTYGPLAAGIVLLLWMQLSSLIILVGGQVNAILHRFSPETRLHPKRRWAQMLRWRRAKQAVREIESGGGGAPLAPPTA